MHVYLGVAKVKRETQRLEQELENNLKTLRDQLEANPTNLDLRDSINNAEDQLKIFFRIFRENLKSLTGKMVYLLK